MHMLNFVCNIFYGMHAKQLVYFLIYSLVFTMWTFKICVKQQHLAVKNHPRCYNETVTSSCLAAGRASMCGFLECEFSVILVLEM